MKKKSVRILNIVCTAGCVFFLAASLALGGIAAAVRPWELKEAAWDPEEREEVLDKSLIEKSRLILAPYHMANRFLDRRYFPENGIYIHPNGFIIQESAPHSTENAADNVEKLYTYCKESGREFLYAILPGKPRSDEDLQSQGLSCFRNFTADKMRDEFRKRGIPLLDVREFFRDDFYSMFYRMDHHWTADAGLRAAGEILKALNREYGSRYDTQRLDPSRFERTVLPDFWVGEQGRKVQGDLADRDDLVLLTPLDPVRLKYHDMETDKEKEGGFEILTRPELLERYNTNITPYYYYMSDLKLLEIDNADVEEGQILMIYDSFSNVVLPFMSLAVGHITAWDMRNSTKVYEYLEEHPEIRTVVIAYTISFMPTSQMNDFQ